MNTGNQESGLKEFLESVNYLFHSNDLNLKKKANQFLIEFISKPESLDISYQVLLKDNLPEEAYYNALNILKNKIKYDFGNYSENPEYIEKLLSFFLNNIDKFKKMNRFILTNYCDCIGKAFLFSGDKFNSLLKNFTLKLYSQNTDNESLLSLLLIFNFLCETKLDKRMVIDEKSRKIFSDNVKNISGDVFQFIVFILNKLNSITDMRLKNFISDLILETVNNYLYLNLEPNIIMKFNNEYLPIIDFIFKLEEENLDKHSECICGLLSLPLQEKSMRNLAQIIFSKIINFKDIFYKTIKTLDAEQASFYIDIFTLMVEKNTKEILKENRLDFFQIIVDLIKKCPEKKMYTLVDFFIYFNEYLYNQNYSIEEIMKNFKNLFIQLIMNFISLTKFDEIIFSKLNISKTKELQNNDEYNITLDFRSAIKDLLKDFLQNYGFHFIFSDILFPEFQNVVSKIKENQNNIDNWNQLENILFIFSCICKYTNPEEPSYENVIILFYTIFDIPKQYIQIMRTVTDILDNYSQILSENKELLLKGFKYLIDGLKNNLIIKYCSVSLKKLLSDNRDVMSEYKQELINLYENQVKNNVIMNDSYLYLIEGLTIVISYSNKDKENEEYNIIKSALIQIMKIWVFYLQQAKSTLEKNNSFSPEENENMKKILTILKSISSSAFEGLNYSNKKIMYEILLEINPSLMYILQKQATNSNIVENTIQLLKIYMRGLINDFIKFIPEYVNCIINGYKLSPISSYLYGFEILVTVFPKRREEDLVKMLNSTFKELCNITLDKYITNINDLELNVQLGEDFYGMIYRTMKASPLIILESEILEKLIKISLDFMTTTQLHVTKNIMIFLKYFIKFQQSDYINNLIKNEKNLAEKCIQIIQNQMNKFNNILCKKILDIYINISVEQIIENVSELFEEFVYCNRILAVKGMSNCLKDCPNDILINKEKDMFIKLIEDYNNKEKEFNKFLDNFINRCYNRQNRSKELN